MNILEHILAGHYPTDDKGRALVPYVSGRTFVCCATDRPHSLRIVGWIRETGELRSHSPESLDLLPPPPRKVKVTRWAVVRIADQAVMDTASTESGAASSHARYHFHDMHKFRVVELSGEIEEPWS